jgi:hypothetical protein
VEITAGLAGGDGHTGDFAAKSLIKFLFEIRQWMLSFTKLSQSFNQQATGKYL